MGASTDKDKLGPGLCWTCRHWTRDDALPADYRGQRKCLHPLFNSEADAGISESGMGYENEGLQTGFAFGCIHWEPITMQSLTEDASK